MLDFLLIIKGLVLAAVPPTIDDEKSSPKVISLVVNGTVSLHCHVSGIPTPKVNWLVNGVALRDLDLSPRLQVVAEGHQLDISRVEVADTTRYTCIATNDAGVDDRDFDLTVLG